MKFYTKEKLFDDPKEGEKILDSYCQYFASFLSKKEKELFGPTQKQVLEELLEELGNLREAWMRAVRNCMEKEIEKLLLGICTIHEIKGMFEQGRELMEAAVQAMKKKYPDASPRSRHSTILLSKLISRWASFERDLGNLGKARALFEESLGLLSSVSGIREAGFPLCELGFVTEREGQYVQAETLYEKGLTSFRKSKDLVGMTMALNRLGYIACRMGKYKKAETFVRQSLRHSKKSRDLRAMAYSYNLFGDILCNSSRLKEGKENYQKALSAYLETGDRRGVAWALVNLGQVAEAKGDFKGAREIYLQSMAISREISDRMAMAWTTNQLGLVCWQVGEYLEARIFSRRACLFTV